MSETLKAQRERVANAIGDEHIGRDYVLDTLRELQRAAMEALFLDQEPDGIVPSGQFRRLLDREEER